MRKARQRPCQQQTHARIGLVAAQGEGMWLASLTYSGTMKASVFEKWFENELLNCLPKGNGITMDNAVFHKKEVLQNLAGEILAEIDFLPPFSVPQHRCRTKIQSASQQIPALPVICLKP